MNRSEFFFRQKVMEDELYNEFSNAENADLAHITDIGLGRDDSSPATLGGIMWGWSATNPSGLNLHFVEGAGYDEQGRRIATAEELDLSVTKSGDTQPGEAGIANGTSTAPAEGKERWVSVFITYDRKQSDLRYDGYDEEVYFSWAESFHFSISLGAEKTIGTLTDSDKPARQDLKLLLYDVWLKTESGITTIYNYETNRKEWLFRIEGSSSPNKSIITGKIRTAIQTLLEYYNEHIADVDDKHAASGIQYTGGQTWADGTAGETGVADDMQEVIDAIVHDLKKTTDVAGTKRLGSKAQTGSLSTPNQGTPGNLTAGTLEAQLTELLAAINGRVFRGGDNGIAGELTPSADGIALGTNSYSWDVRSRDLWVRGNIKSALIPNISNTHDLGSDTLRFRDLFVSRDVSINGNLDVDGDVTIDAAGSLTADCDSTFNGAADFNAAVTLDGETTANDLVYLSGGSVFSGVARNEVRNQMEFGDRDTPSQITILNRGGVMARQDWGLAFPYIGDSDAYYDPTTGTFVMQKGLLLQPYADSSPRIREDPVNLTLANKVVKRRYAKWAGSAAADLAVVEQTNAFGRKVTGNRFRDDFCNILAADYNWSVSVPTYKPYQVAGNSSQILSNSNYGPFFYNAPAAVTDSEAYIAGPGMFDMQGNNITYFFARLNVEGSAALDDSTLFVGLTSEAPGSLPNLAVGAQDFIGFYSNSALTRWDLVVSNKSTFNTNAHKAFSVGGGLTDFYFAISYGSPNFDIWCWMTGDASVAHYTSSLTFTDRMGYFYIYLKTLENSTHAYYLYKVDIYTGIMLNDSDSD